MKLAVIGSRDFADAARLAAILDPYLGRIEMLVSGGAPGADTLAEHWAVAHGVACRIFRPAAAERRAYLARNRLIAEAADQVVAFWNGRSTGTKYTIDYARGLGKDVRIVTV